MTMMLGHFTLRFAGSGTFDGEPACFDIKVPMGLRCETVEGVQQLQLLVYRMQQCSPIDDLPADPACYTFIAEPDIDETDFWYRDSFFAFEIPNFDCESSDWSDPMDGDSTDATTSFQWLNIPSTAGYLTGGFHWREGGVSKSLALELSVRVAFGAPACPAYTGSVDHAGPTPPYRGNWSGQWCAGDVGGSDPIEADEFIIYSPSDFDPSDLNQCECGDYTPPIGIPPLPADTDVACNDDLMSSVILATIGAGTGTCTCVASGGTFTFVFYWFNDDLFGHGVYVSNLLRLCGHSVHFRITCADSGGVDTWFLEGFVDGVSTGTLAWDLLPGNDAGNPNHFEFHWDLFGDLCTGRLFVVAG